MKNTIKRMILLVPVHILEMFPFVFSILTLVSVFFGLMFGIKVGVITFFVYLAIFVVVLGIVFITIKMEGTMRKLRKWAEK